MILYSDYIQINGSFHDAKINILSIDPENRTLHISVEDLKELPEYPKKKGGSLYFTDLKELKWDWQFDEGMTIYDISLAENNESLDIEIAISPSGRLQFQCTGAFVILT